MEDRLVFDFFTNIWLISNFLDLEMSNYLEDRYGLESREMFYIWLLFYAGGLTSGEIAEYARRNRPYISKMIHSLQKRELITITRGEEDKRVHIIRLTDKGKELYWNSKIDFLKYYSEINKTISKEELVKAINVLRKCLSILTNIEESR